MNIKVIACVALVVVVSMDEANGQQQWQGPQYGGELIKVF